MNMTRSRVHSPPVNPAPKHHASKLEQLRDAITCRSLVTQQTYNKLQTVVCQRSRSGNSVTLCCPRDINSSIFLPLLLFPILLDMIFKNVVIVRFVSPETDFVAAFPVLVVFMFCTMSCFPNMKGAQKMQFY